MLRKKKDSYLVTLNHALITASLYVFNANKDKKSKNKFISFCNANKHKDMGIVDFSDFFNTAALPFSRTGCDWVHNSLLKVFYHEIKYGDKVVRGESYSSGFDAAVNAFFKIIENEKIYRNFTLEMLMPPNHPESFNHIGKIPHYSAKMNDGNLYEASLVFGKSGLECQIWNVVNNDLDNVDFLGRFLLKGKKLMSNDNVVGELIIEYID